MAGTIWERFEHDPRRPENAPLRASDRDRDVVQDVLDKAFADGRLDREELDERTDQLLASKTLGQLPALVRDLVSTSNAPARSAPADLQAEAEQRYQRRVRDALWSFLTPTLICWVIWAVTGAGFPWPIFVMLSGLGLLKLLTSRADTIASIEHNLRRQEQRRIEKHARNQRRSLGPGPWPFSE